MNIKRSTRKALADKEQHQSWLAKKLKATEPQVSVWINSENLNTRLIKRIADVFGMTVGEFIRLGE